jgi:hypothetical protein
MPIHYHETHGLFDGVVGGLDFRVGDEKGFFWNYLGIFHWMV